MAWVNIQGVVGSHIAHVNDKKELMVSLGTNYQTPVTIQNAAAANGNGTNANVTGYATVVFDVESAVAMTATINFECSNDGTNWYPLVVTRIGSGDTMSTTATVVGLYRAACAGLVYVRARISGYSAGTITVKAYVTSAETANKVVTAVGPLSTIPVTIANGASLSGVIDLGSYKIAGVIMPAAWTPAVLTFMVSQAADGTFVSAYDDDGVEYSATVDVLRYVALDRLAMLFAGARFIKLRSGTAATPVNQGADRALTLVLKG